MKSIRISRLIVFVLLSAVMASPMAARGSSESDNSSTNIILTDHYGRKVALDAPPAAIVSLSPGITETVFALGYGERLIGRTDFCDYPPEAARVASMGSLMEPNVEAIVAAGPDLVIASTHFPQEALARLEAAGQTVAVLMGQESFQGTYDGVIRPAALLLGDISAGESLIGAMESERKKAAAKAAGFPRKASVYYVVGFGESGDWTAGGDTFIGEMIRQAGARNIADDVKGWSFSIEALVERDPDLILIPAWADGIFQTSPIYKDLRAVRERHVRVIDENIIVRQGPRLAAGYTDLVDAVGSVF
jgi:iron complex transport system substrate-binding protein